MTDIELIAKIRDGELPPAPIQELIGLDLVEADEGMTVFALTPRREHYNPLGSVHGGIAGTLLDSCMGAAVHTTLGDGEAYSTLEIKFNLVRPITADTGRILATGRVVHRGSRVATAEAALRSEGDGKLLAHGTSTCLLL
jgi:uncharacterized protein (TIGR00369 family)